MSGVIVSCGCRKRENLLPAKETVSYFEGTCIALLANGKLPKNNRSGKKGVFWDSGSKKWRAVITIQGKVIQLGFYENFADAVAARKRGEDKYHRPVIEKYEQRTAKNNITTT